MPSRPQAPTPSPSLHDLPLRDPRSPIASLTFADSTRSSWSGKLLSRSPFSTAVNAPELGTFLLSQSVKKPLLVLKKVKKKHSGVEESGGDADSAKVELEVIGIIQHRILFKNRPKALVSKPEPTVKERAEASDSNGSNQTA